MILAADDMSHSHFVVVYDIDQMKNRFSQTLGYDKVIELGGVKLDPASDEILKRDFLIGVFEPDYFDATVDFLWNFV